MQLGEAAIRSQWLRPVHCECPSRFKSASSGQSSGAAKRGRGHPSGTPALRVPSRGGPPPPPLPKRRIEKLGSSARPALASDCASSSPSKFASSDARKKSYNGIVRLFSIDRRNNATACLSFDQEPSYGAREVQPEPSKTVARRETESLFFMSLCFFGATDKNHSETDISMSCRRFGSSAKALSNSAMPCSDRWVWFKPPPMISCASASFGLKESTLAIVVSAAARRASKSFDRWAPPTE